MKEKVLICHLDEATYTKLKVWRIKLGLKDKDWNEFFNIVLRDVHIWEPLTETITRRTWEKLMPTWAENFALNLPSIRKGKAINNLEGYGEGKAAIVIGAGPSLWRKKHLEQLANSNFEGIVLISDRVLKDALKAGVTPDKFDIFVGSVDGSEIIKRYYDDPLINKFGNRIKGLFASTASPSAREKAEKAGIQIFWFNPPLDDWRKNESFTRLMGMMTKTQHRPKGIGVLRSGGQVGCGLNIMAHAVMNCKVSALIGMDSGYLPDTPIEKTEYYNAILKMVNGNVMKASKYFRKIYNPYFKCYTLVDFMFDSYREIWLEVVNNLPLNHKVYNCTEGGCLFGGRIQCMKFKEFIANYKKLGGE